jgi:hypothetical protein
MRCVDIWSCFLTWYVYMLKVVVVVVIIIFQGLDFLACSGSEFIFWNLWIYWTVGRIPCTWDRPDARPLPTHRATQHRKKGHTSVPRVGFEPMIPVFKRPKTVRASDRSAIGTVCMSKHCPEICMGNWGKLRILYVGKTTYRPRFEPVTSRICLHPYGYTILFGTKFGQSPTWDHWAKLLRTVPCSDESFSDPASWCSRWRVSVSIITRPSKCLFLMEAMRTPLVAKWVFSLFLALS